MTFFKWFLPGMKIKRWLSLIIVGLLLIGAGFSIVIDLEILSLLENYVRLVAFQLLGIFSSGIIAFLVITLGLILTVFGFREMVKSLFEAVDPKNDNRLVEIIYKERHLNRGPKIVVIGGGTGIPVLLRGLKDFTSNITAVVTVADDGGSSGRLRGEMGILPPGDIRNCLVALADKEPLMEELLQYRFTSEKELDGHNLGNLLIASMTKITGNFEVAIREMSKVLAIKGQVLPSTLREVVLGAKLEDGEVIHGESKIPKSGKKIKEVFLEPADSEALPEALRAIEEADAIILGPGSLFTSVIPNLLIKDLAKAIKKSKALKAYVCNVMTQTGETDGYSASRHAKEIIKHAGLGLFEYVMVNNEEIPKDLKRKYKKEGSSAVKVDSRKIEKLGLKPVEENLVFKRDIVRHDPEKLAVAVLKLIFKEQKKGKKVKFIDLLLSRYSFRGIGKK